MMIKMNRLITHELCVFVGGDVGVSVVVGQVEPLNPSRGEILMNELFGSWTLLRYGLNTIAGMMVAVVLVLVGREVGGCGSD